ncbi:MAG: DUF5615 family PIN-like protein [Dysgonamonadaceae bacterium]|jgi:predicted nuclease of predicted toxin-antitoxin system|nr:DUF5615 family PIN-like protein [Dysgonamonadaceae bacterium]
MKILLDANISWKLINILSPIYEECDHVDLTGLNVPANDIDIWNYALANGYIYFTRYGFVHPDLSKINDLW